MMLRRPVHAATADHGDDVVIITGMRAACALAGNPIGVRAGWGRQKGEDRANVIGAVFVSGAFAVRTGESRGATQ